MVDGEQGPTILTVVENYAKVETRVNPDVFLLENYAALQTRFLVISPYLSFELHCIALIIRILVAGFKAVSKYQHLMLSLNAGFMRLHLWFLH